MQYQSDTLQINADALAVYAALTDDFNPIHMDPAFAARTPMKGVIAHGTLSLALVWQALGRVPGVQPELLALEIRFVKPVRLGDRVRASATPGLPGEYHASVLNQRQEVVIEGSAILRAD